ncbi:MAG TPA: ATP-dependent protease ATPase subunit HslU, partial [Thermoanaerobaculia bacterium]|nr:ATP-dependent protease ATPase subunit HslU [Thermoanaerobaculia bacterium]
MTKPSPGHERDFAGFVEDLRPREIVSELDKYVVGQRRAKRAVAIALRNRWRRQQLDPAIAEEISPKNILMIGPTGVGKTEIARRLAKLARAPFIKVEASKFTEVGYVGRDVDAIVRDLVAAAVDMVRREKQAEVRGKAAARVEERLLDLLLPPPRPSPASEGPETPPAPETFAATRERLRAQLRAGQLDSRSVEVEVPERTVPTFQILGSQGAEEMDVAIRDMLPGLFGQRTKRRTLPLPEAREVLRQEEEARLVDQDQVAREAVERAESSGIVFLDEIDKIAGRETAHGPDVSREGVQRDLLPIVEGTTVSTKYGPVRTDHVLFVAAGAFHVSKPTDLIPELQGRFPIRVELQSLGEADLLRILTEPQNALVGQYRDLLG